MHFTTIAFSRFLQLSPYSRHAILTTKNHGKKCIGMENPLSTPSWVTTTVKYGLQSLPPTALRDAFEVCLNCLSTWILVAQRLALRFLSQWQLIGWVKRVSFSVSSLEWQKSSNSFHFVTMQWCIIWWVWLCSAVDRSRLEPHYPHIAGRWHCTT